MEKFNFDQLFVLDLANNHQGDVPHALNIIKQASEQVNKYNIRAGIKFQFRHLDTFIHEDFKGNKEVKHINRFESTRLDLEAYQQLVQEIKKQGVLTICTPFDEISVDHICDLNIDVVKVASCSSQDWPLLRKIATVKKPVIVSTAGLSISKIDKLVSFLKGYNVEFAIMHCVAIYPTPDEELQLNQIDVLRDRYADIPIGFSTHEDQDNISPVQIAVAKRSQLFERHIGLNTESYKLNAYSSTPEQLDKWFAAYRKAIAICGAYNSRPSPLIEKESLRTLKRGVYLKQDIKMGSAINSDDVYFAMPAQDGQMTSEQYRDGIVADIDYSINQSLPQKLCNTQQTEKDIILDIVLQVRGMLNNAKIYVGKDVSLEISHHYGLRHFREFGCVILTCINRTYCKKLIIQLPRQKHPYHLHKKKEESFQLLSGDLEVELNGQRKKLELGDVVLVEPDTWHKFHTLDGAIFEEISTTHYNDDSFYDDERISELTRDMRKTIVENWGALEYLTYPNEESEAVSKETEAVYV
jgi:sialic acid synthase SpsE/mannose-6-phosphate isomerase-like protein (cupin superfamily)